MGTMIIPVQDYNIMHLIKYWPYGLVNSGGPINHDLLFLFNIETTHSIEYFERIWDRKIVNPLEVIRIESDERADELWHNKASLPHFYKHIWIRETGSEKEPAVFDSIWGYYFLKSIDFFCRYFGQKCRCMLKVLSPPYLKIFIQGNQAYFYLKIDEAALPHIPDLMKKIISWPMGDMYLKGKLPDCEKKIKKTDRYI